MRCWESTNLRVLETMTLLKTVFFWRFRNFTHDLFFLNHGLAHCWFLKTKTTVSSYHFPPLKLHHPNRSNLNLNNFEIAYFVEAPCGKLINFFLSVLSHLEL